MALSVLAYALVDGSAPAGEGALVTSPVVGAPYDLDVCWGPAPGDPSQAYQTSLSGVTEISDYSEALFQGHRVALPAGYVTGIEQGWNPDAKSVYLPKQPLTAALAWWRVSFPSLGAATVTLLGVGTIGFTVVAAPVVTMATVTIKDWQPLARIPARLVSIAFSGVYPTGGLTLSPDMLGLSGMLYGEINDQAAYRFWWDVSTNLLHAYTASGEASGTVNISTTGLFIGTAG